MIAAAVSLILLSAGWFLLRCSEESRRIDDLIGTVMSTPLDDDGSETDTAATK